MTKNSTKSPIQGSQAETAVDLLDDWFDPIEIGLRDRVRALIQTMIESELEAVLSRSRYARRPKADPTNADEMGRVTGHRHGHRSRSLLGTFGRGGARGAAGQARHRRGQDHGMEEQSAAGLPAAHQAGRFADRWRLSCRYQHASGYAGRCQPCSVAQSARTR